MDEMGRVGIGDYGVRAGVKRVKGKNRKENRTLMHVTNASLRPEHALYYWLMVKSHKHVHTHMHTHTHTHTAQTHKR